MINYVDMYLSSFLRMNNSDYNISRVCLVGFSGHLLRDENEEIELMICMPPPPSFCPINLLGLQSHINDVYN